MEYESKLLELFGLEIMEDEETNFVFDKNCNIVGKVEKGLLYSKMSGIETKGYKTTVTHGNLLWNNKREFNEECNSNDEYHFNLVFKGECYEVSLTLDSPSFTIRNAKKETISFSTYKGGFSLSHIVGQNTDEINASSTSYKYVGTSSDWEVPNKEFDKYEFLANMNCNNTMCIKEELSIEDEVMESKETLCNCSIEDLITSNDAVLTLFNNVREKVNELFDLNQDIFEALFRGSNMPKSLRIFTKNNAKMITL